MQSDGQVQYDGFEYNWFFRKHKWSATSAAWVRRRRWIRLMMRPATSHLPPSTNGHITSSTSPSLNAPARAIQNQSLVISDGGPSRLSWKSGIQSLPPSASSSRSATSSVAPGFIWQGDGGDDWERCHDYLRSLTRDGKKLEAWKLWLGLHDIVEGGGEEENLGGVNITKKRWTEDEGLLPSQALVASPKVDDVSTTPPRDWIVAAIREHVSVSLRWNSVLSSPKMFPRWMKSCKPSCTPTPELSSSMHLGRSETTWAGMLKSSSVRTKQNSGATRF